MREMKWPILPSPLLAIAIRMATLPAAGIALLLVTPTAASAEPVKAPSDVEIIDPAIAGSETDGAEIDDPEGGSEIEPQWESCLVDAYGNEACFEDYGDKFWVYDGYADGASAAALWWTDYGRSDICYNSKGAGTWDLCNYDMREDGTVCWKTCYQNRSAGGALYCTATYRCRYINGD